jgi:hypothetical protein
VARREAGERIRRRTEIAECAVSLSPMRADPVAAEPAERSCVLSLASVGEDQALDLLSLSRALLRRRLIFVRTLVRSLSSSGRRRPSASSCCSLSLVCTIFNTLLAGNAERCLILSRSQASCCRSGEGSRMLVRSVSSLGRRRPMACSLSLSSELLL